MDVTQITARTLNSTYIFDVEQKIVRRFNEDGVRVLAYERIPVINVGRSMLFTMLYASGAGELVKTSTVLEVSVSSHA